MFFFKMQVHKKENDYAIMPELIESISSSRMYFNIIQFKRNVFHIWCEIGYENSIALNRFIISKLQVRMLYVTVSVNMESLVWLPVMKCF